MLRSTKSWVFLLFAIAGSVATGCVKASDFGDGDGVDAKSNCALGTLGCLCDAWGGCDLGLACIRDRCEPVESGTQETNPGAVTTSADTTTSPIPDPGTKPGTEPNTTQEPGEPGEPDSSQGTGQTSSTTSDSSSSSHDSCEDGLVNFNETDVDCGGPACPGCQNGRRCLINLDCVSQYCGDGICVADQEPACSSDADCGDNNPCTQDQCINKRCQHSNAADGTACEDKQRCTINDRCLAGRCTGQDTRVFYETFSNPETLGFELRYSPPQRLWEAGTARASSCSDPGYVEDPSNDHTQDMANGVLGVDIGGCSQDAGMRDLDCAWTRYIDVSFFDDDLNFSFWRRIATPGIRSGRDGMRVRNFQYYRLEGDDTLHEFKTGWDNKKNDRRWTYDEAIIPREKVTAPVSFGICYRRLGGRGSFAGWSVDDVKLRQVGCEPKS